MVSAAWSEEGIVVARLVAIGGLGVTRVVVVQGKQGSGKDRGGDRWGYKSGEEETV